MRNVSTCARASPSLYGNNGSSPFCRYYLSGTDAYRLKLLLPMTPAMLAAHEMQRLAHEQATEQPSPAHQQHVQHARPEQPVTL